MPISPGPRVGEPVWQAADVGTCISAPGAAGELYCVGGCSQVGLPTPPTPIAGTTGEE